MKRIIILTACLLLLCGCKHVKYVEVERVRTDTLEVVVHKKDSVHVFDSVYVKEQMKGDTVLVCSVKWRTQYVEKQVHDTVLHVVRDSVPVPVTEVKEVQHSQTFWEKICSGCWNTAALAAIVALVWLFVRNKRE